MKNMKNISLTVSMFGAYQVINYIIKRIQMVFSCMAHFVRDMRDSLHHFRHSSQFASCLNMYYIYIYNIEHFDMQLVALAFSLLWCELGIPGLDAHCSLCTSDILRINPSPQQNSLCCIHDVWRFLTSSSAKKMFTSGSQMV